LARKTRERNDHPEYRLDLDKLGPYSSLPLGEGWGAILASLRKDDPSNRIYDDKEALPVLERIYALPEKKKGGLGYYPVFVLDAHDPLNLLRTKPDLVVGALALQPRPEPRRGGFHEGARLSLHTPAEMIVNRWCREIGVAVLCDRHENEDKPHEEVRYRVILTGQLAP
jgi:hypothetical protein